MTSLRLVWFTPFLLSIGAGGCSSKSTAKGSENGGIGGVAGAGGLAGAGLKSKDLVVD